MVTAVPAIISWDHPRVCGKNGFSTMGMMATMGSPPRMREKLKSSKIPSGCLRITPAYAGKTKSSLLNLVVVQDHPRVCGKNLASSTGFLYNAGSPPRMREKHVDETQFLWFNRITPAYAGKTLKDPNEIKTFLSF